MAEKIKNLSDRLLTRAEVAEIFQVSPSTITRWAEAGKLPMVKTLGGHRRYEAGVVMKLAQRFIATPTNETNETLAAEEVSVKKILINVPAMYGDHHVLEVRRLLLEMPGVAEVNASSCFQTVEVTYDPTKLSADEIEGKLDETGYFETLPIPVEKGVTAEDQLKPDRKRYFRHTTAYEQVKRIVSFAQDVHHTWPALWPCPGIGVIKKIEPEKEVSHG